MEVLLSAEGLIAILTLSFLPTRQGIYHSIVQAFIIRGQLQQIPVQLHKRIAA